MRVSVNMMKEHAPELEKSQAVAVTRSRDEDGSYHVESRQNLSTFNLLASANIVFSFSPRSNCEKVCDSIVKIFSRFAYII